MSLTRADLETLSAVDISDKIPEEQTRLALASPPFVPGPLLNLRDLGLVPGTSIRPNLIFRCGSIEDNDATRAWIAQNVRKVFDLRGDREIQRSPDPTVPGVENVRRPLNGKQERLDLEGFAIDDGAAAWRTQYMVILDMYSPMFKAVLEHVRDSGEPFLFHCTAGRDRTGLLADMLHHLGGTPDTDAVYDYLLSRVGLEPARGMLVLALKAGFSAQDIESPGFHNVASIRPSFWQAFRDGLNDKYGGWDGYITHLGFTDDDVATMKANLRRRD